MLLLPQMAELPESEIRRLVGSRLREGSLLAATETIRPALAADGSHSCVVCGFTIAAGRNECRVAGAPTHERCAVIWREESDRAL